MKKHAFIFAALSACLVVSCNKEQSTVINEEPAVDPQEVVTKPEEQWQTITINASVDEGVTKTSYEGGTAFQWTKGDKISVSCSDGNFYPFTADKTGTSSTFTGSIPTGESLGTKAYFPADENHTSDDFYLPSYKDISSHDSADIPMIGKKGEGDAYSFIHCAGAALLTITNIPAAVTTATITVESYNSENASECVKLSGSFYISGSSGDSPHWDGAYAATAAEKQFSRKVKVSDNTAMVYVVCAGGYNNWVPNKLTVVGHTSEGDVTLFNEKAMKKLGTVERAHVLPITPLPVCNLSTVNWTASGVYSSTVDPGSDKQGLSEMKVTSDAYYLYARVKAPVTGFAGDFLDIFLSDGSGDHYALADDNQYWTTGGTTVYREQHRGTVTSTSLSMTFNGKSVDTITENDGTDIYYYMAFRRSAHSLLSSAGTVYVSFMMWKGWSCNGCIPTRYTSMLAVTLP